jgi:hypothetical protein
VKKTDKNPKIHRQKTYDLTLTKFELLHIRDLFSVLLPPNGAQTLSQALAEAEGRNLIESMLWEKVSSLCEVADLPLGSESPDYIIAPISSPSLGVFHINHDVDQQESQESSEGEGFLPDDSTEEESDEEDE